MEAIDAVEKEIEKVISKFSCVKKQSEETINEIISVLSVCSSSVCKQKSSDLLLFNLFIIYFKDFYLYF